MLKTLGSQLQLCEISAELVQPLFLDLKKTPGPGTYNTIDPSIYRYRQHVYSMTGRNLQPGDTTKKPGPGAHREVVKFY